MTAVLSPKEQVLIRDTFETDAEEVISIIAEYGVKYISYYESMDCRIAFHPNKREHLVFEHSTSTVDDWTFSLSLTGRELQKVFDHFGITAPIFSAVLYPVSDNCSETADNPLVEKDYDRTLWIP